MSLRIAWSHVSPVAHIDHFWFGSIVIWGVAQPRHHHSYRLGDGPQSGNRTEITFAIETGIFLKVRAGEDGDPCQCATSSAFEPFRDAMSEDNL